MATLTNTKIKDTYDGLLKTTDNDVIGITEKVITDGLGNASILSIGTQSASFSENIKINGQTFGVGAGSVATNIAIGYQSLNSNTTGGFNTAIGGASAYLNTTGAFNIAISGSALFSNTTGGHNIALGNAALYNLTGSYNIAMGYQAGYYSTGTLNKTAGDYNIYIGANTVSGGQDTDNEIVIGYNTTGNGSNTATYGNSSITDHYFDGNVRADFFYGDGSNLTNLPVGAIPTLDQVTGAGATSSVNVTINGADLGTITNSSNTLFGDGALASHTSGSSNTAIGQNALTAYTGGSHNTAIGAGTLDAIISSSNFRNTGVGYSALGSGTTLVGNTSVGYEALLNINGQYNVALGYNAGKLIFGGNKTLGDNNVYIGANTDSAAADTDNEIVIGANATGNGSNSATYGDSNVTKHIFTGGSVGIGTSSPASLMHIRGAAATLTLGDSTQSSSSVSTILFKNLDGNGANREIVKIKGLTGANGGYGNIVFETAFNNTLSERMRINASGNVTLRGNDLDLNNGNTLHRITNSNTDLLIRADYNNTSANSTIQFSIDGSERMRIDSSGNVGIKGSALLAAGLGYAGDTTSAGAGKIKLYDSSTGALIIDGFGAGYLANSGIQFQVAGSEKMRITSGGEVLVAGLTDNTPNGEPATGQIVTYSNGSKYGILVAANSTSGRSMIAFSNPTTPNAIVGEIVSSGSSTAYNTTSDYRLKENVVEMTGALDRVDALKPSRFNFIADPNKTVDGFLAHEVQAIVPEAVTGEKDAVKEYEVTPAILDEDGNVIEEAVMGTRPVYQGIDQSKIVPLLVGAIKELRAEIETLKSQLNA